MALSRVTCQPRRFYDGGATGDGRPDPRSDPRIVLEWHLEDGVETFSMERAIAYDDRELGELVVPAGPGFRTDLTSVPWLFTWLVPRTGAHLPAALLHDGLVGDAEGESSYRSTEGHVVARDRADRVFRDALADAGTGVVRRWLVWTAVTTATILLGSRSWTTVQRWRYRVAAAATVAVVVVLGTLATLDLFDVAVRLPWMGDRPWWSELVGGFAGAVAIPFLLGLTWGRLRVAGVVLGVLLAVLLHVTVALLLLTGLYQAAEWLARTSPAGAWIAAGVLVAAAAALVAAYAWA